MYDLSNICLNVIMAFATCWIVGRFYTVIFKRKTKHAGLWGVYFVLQLVIEGNRGNASIGLTMLNIVLIIILGVATYEYTWKTLVFGVICLCFIWSLLEMLVYYALGFTALPKVESNMLGTVISKILVIIAIGVISARGKSKRFINMSAGIYFLLIVIPLGSIYFAVVEFFQYQYSFISLFKFALLILFNLVTFQIYFYIAEKYAVEYEKRIYEQQIDYLTRNKEDEKRNMDAFYEEKHNLKNILLSMRSDIERDDKETVLKGLDGILENIESGSLKVHSGNENIDAILNGKFALAVYKKIMVQYEMTLPQMDSFNKYDMAILLGAALDNALEAAEQCDEESRYIGVFIGVKKGTLAIIIENSFVGELQIDRKGNLLSTKMDSNKHGYGIQSIYKIVEKYDGDVSIMHEKGVFKMNIIIPVGNFDSK